MKQDEYELKLSQVADMQIAPLSDRDIKSSHQGRRGRKTQEQLYQEEHLEIFLDVYQGINPTHTPQLVALKTASCVCGACGNSCPNGRRTEFKRFTQAPAHWRETCLTCNLVQNPNTGAFDLTRAAAPRVWQEHMVRLKSQIRQAKRAQDK